MDNVAVAEALPDAAHQESAHQVRSPVDNEEKCSCYESEVRPPNAFWGNVAVTEFSSYAAEADSLAFEASTVPAPS